MFIKEAQLKNHPLIHDCILSFSLPDNSNEGSGINYFVGVSGSGKTKYLDFLFHGLRSGPSINRQVDRIERSLFEGLLIDEENKQLDGHAGFIEIISDSPKEPLEDHLFLTERTSIPTRTGVYKIIRQGKTRQNKSFQKNQRNSGTGEARYNSIFEQIDSVLKNERNKVVIIEEPEAFLDPLIQLKLLKKISELAKTKQVFVATHSPYIVDWKCLKNGASIFKVNRTNNESVIGHFCNPKIASLVDNPGNKRPHLNSVETKNIFFSNKVFIVEGQEDVGLITDYFFVNEIEYDFSFFGYGTGGASKIVSILEMCHALKIPKVVALFDYDEKERSVNFERCEKKYGSSYCILELEAEDIRDKFKETKDGLVQTHSGAFEADKLNNVLGLKKDKYGVDFENKITEAINYF